MRPWLISGLTLVCDQLTKAITVASLTPGQSLPLLPHVLHVTYVQNTGAAFGLFKGQQLVFIVFSIIVIAWMIRELLTKPAMDKVRRWACALLLGGAAGNLIDRLRFGYVVDFIDLRVWPVFNIGDSAITIGVSLLVLHSILRRQTGNG